MLTIVSNTSDGGPRGLARAAELREQAEGLLQRLLERRAASEQRALDAGRRDPMRSITGRSALDEAIVRTRAMLREIDEMLDRGAGQRSVSAVLPSHRPAALSARARR